MQPSQAPTIAASEDSVQSSVYKQPISWTQKENEQYLQAIEEVKVTSQDTFNNNKYLFQQVQKIHEQNGYSRTLGALTTHYAVLRQKQALEEQDIGKQEHNQASQANDNNSLHTSTSDAKAARIKRDASYFKDDDLEFSSDNEPAHHLKAKRSVELEDPIKHQLLTRQIKPPLPFLEE